MSKVLGPFLSFHATGNIGKSLTAKQWKGIKQVIRYSKPSGPPSAAQTAQRLRVHNAMLSWRKFLHPTDAGTAWNLLAKSIRPHIWGYNHALKSLIPQLAADADASYAISIEEKGTGKVYVEMQNMDDGTTGDEFGLFDIWSGSDPRALYKIGSNAIVTGNVATPSLGSSGDTVYFRLIKSYWRSGIYKITLLYPEIVLDLMEYASDAAAQAAYVSSDSGQSYGPDVMTGGTPTASSTHSTSDPANAVDNDDLTFWSNDGDGPPSWWKYDLGNGNGKTVRKLRLKPGHGITVRVKDFTLQGSNNDSDWDVILTGQHANNTDWETYTFANATSYRYYKINVTTSWEGLAWIQIFELEMMEAQPNLQSYSESMIKTQGSYSLKGIATTANVAGILTRTIDPTIDLRGMDHLTFDVRSSLAGIKVAIQWRNANGWLLNSMPTIVAANVWQHVIKDISTLADVNKNSINRIATGPLVAAEAITFYIDNMYAY